MGGSENDLQGVEIVFAGVQFGYGCGKIVWGGVQSRFHRSELAQTAKKRLGSKGHLQVDKSSRRTGRWAHPTNHETDSASAMCILAIKASFATHSTNEVLYFVLTTPQNLQL